MFGVLGTEVRVVEFGDLGILVPYSGNTYEFGLVTGCDVVVCPTMLGFAFWG